MSHLSTISNVSILDLDALAAACKRLGLELVRGQQTHRWFGRFVGDSPMPEGFTVEDLGHCDHAIRLADRKARDVGGAYEIGLVRRRDGRPGWQLIYDNWQGGYGLEKAAGKGLEYLQNAYNAEVASRHYRRAGWRAQLAGPPEKLELRLSR